MGETAGRRWVWVIAAVVVVAVIGYGVVHALTADAGTAPVARPTVAVDAGPVSTRVATTGTLQPAQTRSLSFAVAGTVDSIAVRPGATVAAGETLAKVDRTDAAAAVDDAQQALDDARAALTEARDSAAKATAAAAKAAASRGSAGGAGSGSPSGGGSSSAGGGGAGSGSPGGAGSGSPGGSGSGSAGGGGGGGQGAAARGGGASPASRPAASPTSPAAPVAPARQSGEDPVLTAQERVNQAEVTLADAQDALDGTDITAPIRGEILAVDSTVGARVSAGATVITLADVQDMQVRADFPEADAGHLAVKQSATATLANHPGTTYRLTVVQVDPTGTVDGSLVRYGVLLAFADPPPDPLVGQSADVVVTTDSVRADLRVPSTAVHDVTGHQGTVLTSAGGKESQVKVGVGLAGDQYTQITSGLAPGERVVPSW